MEKVKENKKKRMSFKQIKFSHDATPFQKIDRNKFRVSQTLDNYSPFDPEEESEMFAKSTPLLKETNTNQSALLIFA